MVGAAAGGFHRLRSPASFAEVRQSGLFRSSTPRQLLSRRLVETVWPNR